MKKQLLSLLLVGGCASLYGMDNNDNNQNDLCFALEKETMQLSKQTIQKHLELIINDSIKPPYHHRAIESLPNIAWELSQMPFDIDTLDEKKLGEVKTDIRTVVLYANTGKVPWKEDLPSSEDFNSICNLLYRCLSYCK